MAALAGRVIVSLVSLVVAVATSFAVLLAVTAVTANRVAGSVVAGVAAAGLAGLVTGRLWRRWWPGVAAGIIAAVPVVGVMTGLVFSEPPAALPSTPSPDTRYWDLPTGSRIAYTMVPGMGQQRDTPVILLHGGPGGPGVPPAALMDALAALGFDVYDYHQVGAGLSSRLRNVRDYTVQRHVADLEAIRRELGAQRMVLIGGSWGAQLIANYAAAHGEHVDRMVLAAPAPIWAQAFDEDARLEPDAARQQQEAALGHPRFLAANLLVQMLGMPRTAHVLFPDDEIDGVFQAFMADLDMWAACPHVDRPLDPGIRDLDVAGAGFWVNLMTTRDARSQPDPRPALSGVHAPALVVRGECDYLRSEIADEYLHVLARATLASVPDAGHTVARDRPDLYRELVVAFLSDAPRPDYAGAVTTTP